jgi:hypothetical protein
MLTDEHAAPQPPQLFLSVDVSKQSELQQAGVVPLHATLHPLQS